MSSRNLPVTRVPSGVTEVEYRRAIQQNRRQNTASSSVDSAALQSEIAKKYNLSAGTRSRASGITANRIVSTASIHGGRRTQPVQQPMICACCNSANPSAEQVCGECGYFLHSIITVPDTLAQRRGLVPIAPPQAPLTPFDWAVIENSRSDPDSCCPICMEGFKQGHEVLLSCSHIFHRACLRSFENFMKDSEFACPICRTKNYQKKITHIGSLAYQKVCALKLQRLFRGYTARKQFRTRLRAFYRATAPGGNTAGIDAGQKQRRKQYYESEITNISNKLDQNLNKRSNQVNNMLRSMDRTLEESQQLDILFEQMLASRQQQSQNLSQNQSTNAPGLASQLGMPPPLNLHRVSGYDMHTEEICEESAELEYADESEEYCEESHTEWKDVYYTALKRFPCDCAICMLPVGVTASIAHTSRVPDIPLVDTEHPVAVKNHKMYNGKKEIILSCSHVFHAKCIANFERFLQATKVRVCPVCRSEYSKKSFRIV